MLILLIFILPVLACDLCLENGVFMWGINGNMEFSPLTKTVKYCVGIFQCSSNICEISDNTSGVTSIILGDFGEAGAHKTVLLYNYNCTNNLTIISRNKNYNLISSASCKDMMDCNSAMCELLLNTDAQYLQIVQH